MGGVVAKVELAFQRECRVPASIRRARPERTRPANSCASGGSARRALPGPQRLSKAEGTCVSDDPDLWLLQHTAGKSITALDSRGQRCSRVDVRIDGAAQSLAQLLQRCV